MLVAEVQENVLVCGAKNTFRSWQLMFPSRLPEAFANILRMVHEGATISVLLDPREPVCSFFLPSQECVDSLECAVGQQHVHVDEQDVRRRRRLACQVAHVRLRVRQDRAQLLRRTGRHYGTKHQLLRLKIGQE